MRVLGAEPPRTAPGHAKTPGFDPGVLLWWAILGSNQ